MEKQMGKKRVCPKCGNIYRDTIDKCPMCRISLEQYCQEKESERENPFWIYILTVLFPVLGIVFAIILFMQDYNAAAKPLVYTSLAAAAGWLIVFFLLHIFMNLV